MDSKIKMGIGVGGPSIIMIFVVLCLTALGALALTTANSDSKLSQKTAEAVTAYYMADGEAQKWYAEMDGQVKTGGVPEDTVFYMPVGDRQALIMELEVRDGGAKVLSERLVVLEDWTYEEFEPQFSDVIAE